MVRRIGENFIPLALNADRLPDTPAGKCFAGLKKQWSQGLWAVAPDGTVLGFHYHRPTPGVPYAQNQRLWVDGTIALLDDAVKKSGPLKPRGVRAGNPFPDRGVGLGRDGGVRLAVCVTAVDGAGQHAGPPAVDSFSLTKEEWAKFLPPAGGGEWAVPEAVAKKFAPAFSPYTDHDFVPQPAGVRKAVVTGKVEREAGGLWVIRYTGRWESFQLREGRADWPVAAAAVGDAVGVYDSAKKELRSLVWVIRGNYRKEVRGGDVPFAAVVEWDGEK